jgi:hypothetical protein
VTTTMMGQNWPKLHRSKIINVGPESVRKRGQNSDLAHISGHDLCSDSVGGVVAWQ